MPRLGRTVRTGGWASTLPLALCLVAGCATKEERHELVSPPARGGGLRILTESPRTLDPVEILQVYEATVLRQVYEGLVGLDPDLRIHPALASSWTISPDGKVYTFLLREGVRFHDGTPLTSEDVAFTLRRCIAPGPGIGCLAQSHLMHIKGAAAYRDGRAPDVSGIHAPDPGTIEIELEEPLSLFLTVLAMDQTMVVSQEGFARTGRPGLLAAPNGTGPFRFVERGADGTLVLARNPRYWGKAALLDTLFFVAIDPEEASREHAALLAGRADFAHISPSDVAEVKAAGLATYRAPELSLSFLGLRADRPPLDLPEIRRAILLAIDREKIQRIDPGVRVVATSFLPPGLPGRDPANRLPARSAEEARRLLRAAGHPDGAGLPPISIGYSRHPRVQAIVESIRDDLAAIGLDARPFPVDWRTLDSLTTRGELQAFLMSWVADIPNADQFLHALFHSEGEGNLFGYVSPEVDRLLEEIRHEPAGPEKTAALGVLQEKILAEPPMIPLYHSASTYAWQPAVQGIEIGPCGLAILELERVYWSAGRVRALRGSFP